MKYYIQFTKEGAYLHGQSPHQRRCNLATSDGRVYRHTPGFVISQHMTIAANEAAAIAALGLTLYAAQPRPLHPVSKFNLTSKIIAAGKSEAFATFIESLPTPEKLIWHAANTIEPTNVMLTSMRTQILSALSMTDQEFDDLFR